MNKLKGLALSILYILRAIGTIGVVLMPILLKGFGYIDWTWDAAILSSCALTIVVVYLKLRHLASL